MKLYEIFATGYVLLILLYMPKHACNLNTLNIFVEFVYF